MGYLCVSVFESETHNTQNLWLGIYIDGSPTFKLSCIQGIYSSRGALGGGHFGPRGGHCGCLHQFPGDRSVFTDSKCWRKHDELDVYPNVMSQPAVKCNSGDPLWLLSCWEHAGVF